MGRGNKKGGKKHKRGKKAGYETKALRFKEDGQEYAQVCMKYASIYCACGVKQI